MIGTDKFTFSISFNCCFTAVCCKKKGCSTAAVFTSSSTTAPTFRLKSTVPRMGTPQRSGNDDFGIPLAININLHLFSCRFPVGEIGYPFGRWPTPTALGAFYNLLHTHTNTHWRPERNETDSSSDGFPGAEKFAKTWSRRRQK